jgi:shikimate kinase
MVPNLVLIGFMGTGKTVVGKTVARRMGRPFVDIDDRIVEAAGMSINDIFQRHGEDLFRDIESEMIEKTSAAQGLVISTGGGSLLRPKNVENLKRTGVLVWLVASAEEIIRRVADDRHRPLLAVPDRVKVVNELLARRMSSYRVCDITVNTEGRNLDTTADEVLDKYEKLVRGWRG